ncbi:MAG: hypothetical protein U0T75_06200 [Chitinophagales bacterium]
MKTDKATVRDPRADWLQALTACEQQIVNMASVLRQVVIATGNDGYSGGLYEEVDTLHLRLGQLVQEIEQQEWPALTDSPMQITIGEVLAMNRLREKVRKMEQSVFLSRYKVNQFFSNCQAA